MKRTFFAVAVTALVLASCNQNSTTKENSSKVEVPEFGATKSKVDIDKAMEGIPTFSSPEIQKEAEAWFAVLKESMTEMQQKGIEANGDQAKIQEIAMEMAEKMKPWNEKVAKLKAKMTPEDLTKFDQYGQSFANSIVNQAQSE